MVLDEIVKLMDVGIIFAISYNKWVSPTQEDVILELQQASPLGVGDFRLNGVTAEELLEVGQIKAVVSPNQSLQHPRERPVITSV
ncbi:unnamed protein product [Linum trigynum]|uniref:Uncharacterized protein n=1 Tax=Linum trigynum TaxID=586398 RepID=A0AAV2F968_9ROSI